QIGIEVFLCPGMFRHGSLLATPQAAINPALASALRADAACRGATGRAANRWISPFAVGWFRNRPRPNTAASTAADIPPAASAELPGLAAVALPFRALPRAVEPPGASVSLPACASCAGRGGPRRWRGSARSAEARREICPAGRAGESCDRRSAAFLAANLLP